MVKCPFCGFDNEDGALFCEQCKSDLGAVTAPAPASPAIPDAVPMADVIEEPIPAAPIIGGHESIPMAAEVSESAFSAPPMAAPAFPLPATPSEPVPPPPPAAVEPSAPPPLTPGAVPPLGAANPAGAVAAPAAVEEGMASPPAAAPAAPAAGEGVKLAPDAKPRLVVLRGQRINVEYPIYEGLNFIGRADEKPVDIDLDDQEPPERVWCSRQHALINLEEGVLTIEDLNSANGTYVNRTKVYPGQKRQLSPNDVIQIGTVQMKVKV